MQCDKERIRSCARAMIGALNSATDTVGKLDKNCIANLVAITLIDKAEMFNIDEEERPGTGAFEPDLSIFNQCLFVEQTS